MRRFWIALFALVTFDCATLQTHPTQTEVDRTRKASIIVMNSITTALGIYDSLLETLEVQEAAGQLSPQTLRELATLGKQFASVSDQALTGLAKVTSMPELNVTVGFVVSQLGPLITRLEQSNKDTLRAFALSLRVILDLLNQYAVVSAPCPTPLVSGVEITCGVLAWQQ